MQEQALQFNWFDLPDPRRIMLEAMQFQFSQTEKLPPGALSQLQFLILQKLLAHCLQHVPYYRERGYSQIKSWDNWYDLPVLTRGEVQEHGETLRADTRDRSRDGSTYPKSSSGSTGRPITVHISERTDLYWQSITIRDHLWHRRDFSQVLAVIKNTGQDRTGPPGKKSSSWGKSSGLFYSTGPCYVVSSSTDVDRQYDWLSELRPGYLLTYPSILRALSERNLAASDPISFMGVTTMGENLSPETREQVRSAFDVKICDMYSCQELGYMALQCPRHDHYHVQAETCLLEVLDENNRACAPGEMGRVVATHLHNNVMPLLRYDIGDYAIAGGDCDCGIRLPVLERILGRSRNLVTRPDGTRIWPTFSVKKLVQILPNAQFQLVQKSADRMLLRIGTDKAVPEDLRLEMKNAINKAMGFASDMDFEVMPELPRNHSGKFEEFMSEI
jgi:phenylacetate-CoA ligase